MPQIVDPESKKRQERLIKLLQAGGSVGYEQLAKRLREARELFHEEIACQIAAPLKKHLATIPQSNYAEKKLLAKHLNAELDSLGLRLCCPKTHQPALLIGDVGNDARGRFQVLVAPPEGGRKLPSLSTPILPELEFMSAPPRRRPEYEWQDHLKRDRTLPKHR